MKTKYAFALLLVSAAALQAAHAAYVVEGSKENRRMSSLVVIKPKNGNPSTAAQRDLPRGHIQSGTQAPNLPRKK